MRSVCWCQVRGQSWKLPKSILESSVFFFFPIKHFRRLKLSLFSSFPSNLQSQSITFNLKSNFFKNTVVPQHLLFSLGFKNVVSIDMLRESFPLLDMVDHNRRPKLPVRKLLTSTTAVVNGVFVEDLMLISSSFPV